MMYEENDKNCTSNETTTPPNSEQVLNSLTLRNLTQDQRLTFFFIYFVICFVSFTLNLASIYTTSRKNFKPFQKSYTISLAISDIIVALFFGVNNMVNMTKAPNNWIMGRFLCYAIPFMQILGSLANSLTMCLIAVDRYRNIVRALKNRGEPKTITSIIIILIPWIVAAAIAYPQTLFIRFLGPVKMNIYDENNPTHLLGQEMIYFCPFHPKENQSLYFGILVPLVFCPIMIVFLYVYTQIAMLIWARRKPFDHRKLIDHSNVTVDSTTGQETKTTNTKSFAVKNDTPNKPYTSKSRTQEERKIRTFKIILIIMFIFFICRMPHWLFNLLRYFLKLNTNMDWVISYTCSAIMIMNTALNPFLYSIMNKTLQYFDKFFQATGDFISKVCCCCCSNADFEDFEKENAFVQAFENPRSSASSAARGPYVIDFKLKTDQSADTLPRKDSKILPN